MAQQIFNSKQAERAFIRHHNDWSECSLCPLADTRCNVVLFRGQLPASLLFIGEAPGTSEDVIGYPFKGESGLLLRELCKRVTNGFYPGQKPLKKGFPNYAITNALGCVPLKNNGTGPTLRPPTSAEMKKCRPRVAEFITICKPKLIVFLGKIAVQSSLSLVPQGCSYLNLTHPSYILHQVSAKKDLEAKRWVLSLSKGIHQHYENLYDT